LIWNENYEDVGYGGRKEGGVSDIDQLPEGRELDARIAVDLFGWLGVNTDHKHRMMGHPPHDLRCWHVVPHFSTDMSAAWWVVEHLCNTVNQISDYRTVTLDVTKDKAICSVDWDEDWRLQAKADAAPLAICRAALRVVVP
jgi:hypothetical protein